MSHHGEKHAPSRTYDKPWRPSDPPRVTHAEWPLRGSQPPAQGQQQRQSPDEDWMRVRERVEQLLATDLDTDHPARAVILALRGDLVSCEDVATRAQLERDRAHRALEALRGRHERLATVARILADAAPDGLWFMGNQVTLPYGLIRELRRVLATEAEKQP